DLEADNWRDALRAASDLHQALANPDPGVLDSLDDQRIRARGGLDKVRGSFRYRRDHFLAQDRDKRATVADYPDFERLMASPRQATPQRLALWSAGRKLARELLATTRQMDEADLGGPPLAAPGGTPTDAAPGTDISDPLRRAQLSIDLLALGGVKDAAGLQ